MKVIVDTSIWSLALRHEDQSSLPCVKELRGLIEDYRVQMMGPIRQEILSGIRSESQFNRLKKNLSGFADLPILTEDYVRAARYFNLCRSKGIQGSNTDFLICAVSVQNELPIYTTDNDFKLFAKHIPIRLYKP
ncbi:MAG: PIN domain-containing protein [Candidatus Aminicenantes bacterium]|jgi:predicted nucleic acid-binding protein|nr:PIN domain-containing protein [Candidatus Aminicenantes bacterium]